MHSRTAVHILAAAALVALTAAAVPDAYAQTHTSPPPVLVAYYGRVKPGQEMAAGKAAMAFKEIYAKANWPTHYLSLWAMTGRDVTAIFVPYESFEAWEKDTYAQMANKPMFDAVNKYVTEWSSHMDDVSTVVLKYRPDLSYHPEVQVAGLRYFDVLHVRLRNGRGADFEALEKKAIAAHEKAGIEEHWATFEVVSGAPFGTLVYFSPTKTLADWDTAEAKHGKGFTDAMGGEDAMKKFETDIQATVGEVEGTLLAIDPMSSYPRKEWIEADPTFWNPKPPAAMKKPAGKKAAAPKN